MIYIDMDGVLCDLVGQVEKDSGLYEIYNKSNYGVYNIQKATSLIKKEALFEYFSRYSFWASMPALSWAHYLIETAEKIDDVYLMSRPWLCDGTGPAEICLRGKISWVARYFPNYLGKLLFVDKKEDFARPDAILIDDNKENCEKFAAAGGKTIFIPTPWGDTDYALRGKTGFKLVKEVIECQTKVVESM